MSGLLALDHTALRGRWEHRSGKGRHEHRAVHTHWAQIRAAGVAVSPKQAVTLGSVCGAGRGPTAREGLAGEQEVQGWRAACWLVPRP